MAILRSSTELRCLNERIDTSDNVSSSCLLRLKQYAGR